MLKRRTIFNWLPHIITTTRSCQQDLSSSIKWIILTSLLFNCFVESTQKIQNCVDDKTLHNKQIFRTKVLFNWFSLYKCRLYEWVQAWRSHKNLIVFIIVSVNFSITSTCDYCLFIDYISYQKRIVFTKLIYN